MNENYWAVQKKGNDLEHSKGVWKHHRYKSKYVKNGKTYYDYGNAIDSAQLKTSLKVLGNQASDAYEHAKGYLSGSRQAKKGSNFLVKAAGSTKAAANKLLLKEDAAVAKTAAKSAASAAKRIISRKTNKLVSDVKGASSKIASGTKKIASKLKTSVKAAKKKYQNKKNGNINDKLIKRKLQAIENGKKAAKKIRLYKKLSAYAKQYGTKK